MRRNFRVYRVLFLSLILIFSYYFLFFQYKTDKTNFNSKISKITEARKYTNINAFSKVYGYVRYFHPSDEASQLDWERFAIYGVSKVKNAKNESELKNRLEELFTPIAPTIKIYFEGDPPKNTKQKSSNKVVAWQYFGPPGDSTPLYQSKRVTAEVKNGKFILEKDKLFSPFPQPNEVTKQKISNDLVCSIPIVLYKNKSRTIGSNQESREKFKKLKSNLLKIDPGMTSEDVNLRYAGVIVAWNILQHFYPYFHVLDVDWEQQLKIALKDTADDKIKDDYISTLSKLMEKTKDGHASFSFDKGDGRSLPFLLDKIENNIVIAVASEDSAFKPGDIVLSIKQNNAKFKMYMGVSGIVFLLAVFMLLFPDAPLLSKGLLK